MKKTPGRSPGCWMKGKPWLLLPWGTPPSIPPTSIPTAGYWPWATTHAAAAVLGTGLCEGSDRLMIVPASHKDVGDCLAVDANYIFMKAGREIGRLRDTLAEYGLLDHAAMVENCGMETERIFPQFSCAPADSGYFSVVVVKRDGN